MLIVSFSVFTSFRHVLRLSSEECGYKCATYQPHTAGDIPSFKLRDEIEQAGSLLMKIGILFTVLSMTV